MTSIELDLDEITADGYFLRWPDNPTPPEDAHLRLAALIGVEPVSFEEINGVYTAIYESPRPEVEIVVTTSTTARWLTNSVHRAGEIPLVWEEPEDVLHTARWWLNIEGSPNWSLVTDQEYIDNLRSNPGPIDETLDV